MWHSCEIFQLNEVLNVQKCRWTQRVNPFFGDHRFSWLACLPNSSHHRRLPPFRGTLSTIRRPPAAWSASAYWSSLQRMAASTIPELQGKKVAGNPCWISGSRDSWKWSGRCSSAEWACAPSGRCRGRGAGSLRLRPPSSADEGRGWRWTKAQSWGPNRRWTPSWRRNWRQTSRRASDGHRCTGRRRPPNGVSLLQLFLQEMLREIRPTGCPWIPRTAAGTSWQPSPGCCVACEQAAGMASCCWYRFRNWCSWHSVGPVCAVASSSAQSISRPSDNEKSLYDSL